MEPRVGKTLPPGARHVRSTPEFTAESVPAGLLRAHRVADGVWGLLRVLSGSVVYVLEEHGDSVTVSAGGAQVIAPGEVHHVEPDDDARFLVEFHQAG